MKQAVFAPGVKFESNTVYTAPGGEYHITLKDSVPLAGKGYAPRDEFVNYGFHLDGLENVTVDLGGATLIFHGRIAPFLIENCRNVTLKNFAMDYDRDYYSQGELLSIDSCGIRLKWDRKNFPMEVVDGVPCAVSETWRTPLNEGHMLWQPYDPRTRAPAENAGCILAVFGTDDYDKNPPLPIHHLELASTDGDVLNIRGEFPETWKPGMIITMTHEKRDKNSILTQDSENISVENVRLLSGASMGFVALFSKDITLRHFDMYLDRRSRGLVTINADSVHAFHCTGKFVIEDCVFENMLDDAVNIHGNYNIAEKCSGNNLAVRVLGHGVGSIRWYRPGDTLAVHRGRTQEIRREVTVKSSVSSAAECLSVVCDEADFAEPGDIIELMAMPEIIIRRCISGKNRPRGFLLSSGGRTLVEDCVFNNCSTGIHFTGDTTYWYESGPVRDVTIRHCYFRDCGYCGDSYPICASPQVELSPAAPYFHRNIVIEDNVFASFSTGLLWAADSEGIVMRRNTFISTGFYGHREVEPVVLNNCGNCEIEIP